MKVRVTKTAVGLLANVFLTVVMAGENQFNKLDADVDGYISTEEAATHEVLQQGWGGVDANNDGKVDAAEFSAFEIKRAANRTPDGK